MILHTIAQLSVLALLVTAIGAVAWIVWYEVRGY